MGGESSKILSEEELNEYTELTYLKKAEILYIFRRFRRLGTEVDHNRGHRYPFSEVLEIFPEFKYNPFNDRICKVFSSLKDGKFSFDDFIDLCSALSENCPEGVRAVWAFKIFDFDEDNHISKSDMVELLSRLTSTSKSRKSMVEDLTLEEKEYIATVMLNDLDLDKTGGIARMEFIHAVSKIPEFSHTFRLRL